MTQKMDASTIEAKKQKKKKIIIIESIYRRDDVFPYTVMMTFTALLSLWRVTRKLVQACKRKKDSVFENERQINGIKYLLDM